MPHSTFIRYCCNNTTTQTKKYPVGICAKENDEATRWVLIRRGDPFPINPGEEGGAQEQCGTTRDKETTSRAD